MCGLRNRDARADADDVLAVVPPVEGVDVPRVSDGVVSGPAVDHVTLSVPGCVDRVGTWASVDQIRAAARLEEVAARTSFQGVATRAAGEDVTASESPE